MHVGSLCVCLDLYGCQQICWHSIIFNGPKKVYRTGPETQIDGKVLESLSQGQIDAATVSQMSND
jgi:hypothetical protein